MYFFWIYQFCTTDGERRKKSRRPKRHAVDLERKILSFALPLIKTFGLELLESGANTRRHLTLNARLVRLENSLSRLQGRQFEFEGARKRLEEGQTEKRLYLPSQSRLERKNRWKVRREKGGRARWRLSQQKNKNWLTTEVLLASLVAYNRLCKNMKTKGKEIQAN